MKLHRRGPANAAVREIDNLMVRGYEIAARKGSAWADYGKASADLWMLVWEMVKHRLPEAPFDLDREKELFGGLRQPLFNWILDVDTALANAGISDPAYRQLRKTFCEEVLARFVMSHNSQTFKQSHANALWQLGQHEAAVQEMRALIDEDPDDAWNYIAWGDFYSFERPYDLDRAETIYRIALARPGVRDREDLQGRLEMLEDMRREEAPQPTATAHASTEPVADSRAAAKPSKTGRNDPCPCGSGKKYKKCCLK